MGEKIETRLCKGTFLDFELEWGLSNNFEDDAKVSKMLLYIVGEQKEVVQIYNSEGNIFQDVIHHFLQYRLRAHQIKGYHLELECVKAAYKCSNLFE